MEEPIQSLRAVSHLGHAYKIRPVFKSVGGLPAYNGRSALAEFEVANDPVAMPLLLPGRERFPGQHHVPVSEPHTPITVALDVHRMFNKTNSVCPFVGLCQDAKDKPAELADKPPHLTRSHNFFIFKY